MPITIETMGKATAGSFLLHDTTPDRIFTCEDLTDEHIDIARTVDAFWASEVEPNLEAQDMCSLVLRDAMRRIETAALTIIGSCVEGAELNDYVSALHSLAFNRPIDSIASRRRIARRLLEEERYVV